MGNKAEYTKGPWSMSIIGESVDINYKFRDKDGTHSGNIGVIDGYSGETGFKRNQANARLIAAAPDLLEACKEALEALCAISNYDRESKEVKALEEGIAKAEGRP